MPLLTIVAADVSNFPRRLTGLGRDERGSDERIGFSASNNTAQAARRVYRPWTDLHLVFLTLNL